ncbi:MAG: hypothetical protein ABL879_09270 [Devosia sp.]
MAQRPSDTPNPMRLAMEKAARQMGFDSAQAFPPPPYHVHDGNIVYLRCAFDPSVARQLLPPEFEPDDNATGTIAIYTIGGGMAIAPYTAGYFGLSVKGHDGPDGDVGCYKLGDFRSGVAGMIYRTRYFADSRDGWGRLWYEGDTQFGEAGPPGRTAIRVTARRTGLVGDETSGVNVYLGKRPDGGGYNRWTVASSGNWHDLADVTIDILPDAPPVLQLLRPREVLWPLLVEGMSFTFSPPVPLEAPADEHLATMVQSGMIDLFSRLGRPALIVSTGRRLLRANEAAIALSGFGLSFEGDRVRAGTADAALDGAIERVLASGHPSEPVAVKRRDAMPLIVHALPLGRNTTTEPAVLFLIVDAERPQRGDIGRTLQLLGLTVAEARLAALIGAGNSPRVSAQSLSITEGTARTTLKAVFGKLAISRQSELAQLVARIDLA